MIRTIQARIDDPVDRIRAAIDPSSVDAENRTFEVVWSTGARAPMSAYIEGEGYLEFDEELSLEPERWDFARVEAGTCPLLDSHAGYYGSSRLDGQIGRVLSVKMTKREARAVCQFSFDPRNDGKWIDIQRGIIRGVSPRYRPTGYEEITKPKDKRRVFRPVIAELREISLTSIPADAGGRVRADRAQSQYTVELTLDSQRETTMPKHNKHDATRGDQAPDHSAVADETPTTTSVDTDDRGDSSDVEPVGGDRARGDRAADARGSRRPAGSTPDVSLDEVRAQERARVAAIGEVARALRIDDDAGQALLQRLIDQGATLEHARTELIYERGRRDQAVIGPSIARVGVEQRDRMRSGIENALLHRCNARAETGAATIALTEHGREFRGLSFLDVAREYLREMGCRVRGLDPYESAGIALGMPGLAERARSAGMHTTSDFANILANVQSKVLRDAYAASPSNWRLIAKRSSAADYKLLTRLQLGDAPQLEKVNEHGEFKRGTIAESRETYQVDDYGKIFGITRKAMINDDLSALDRVPAMFGRQAAELEAAKAIGLLLANPLMADGNALISSAHANTTTGAISVTSLNAAMVALMTQRGLDGATLVGNTPTYLIVPAALATLARQHTTTLTPAQPSQANPFIGMFRAIIVEPRLDVGVDGQAADAVKWWMTSDPAQVDMLEYAYLAGQEGVYIEQQVGFEIDGLQTKVRHTFGVGVLDWRGFVRSTGV